MKANTLPFVPLVLAALALTPWLRAAPADSPETFRELLRTYVRASAADTSRDDSDDSNDFDDTDDRYAALLGPEDSDDVDAAVNDALGLLTIRKNEFNFYTGSVTIGGVRHAIKGRFNRNGEDTRTLKKGGRKLDFAMQLGGTGARLTGSVTPQDGGLASLFDGGRSRFRPRQPSLAAGRYTVLFPGDDQNPATGFPKGDGYGVMSVGKLGTMRLAGRLADGTRVGLGIPVSVGGEVPIYRPLFRNNGSISGLVDFTEDPGVSDASGTMKIFKPAARKPGGLYTGGYSIKVPFLASRYVRPRGVRILEELDATNGAADLVFGEGNLAAGITQPILVDTRNRVSMDGAPIMPLRVEVKKKSGLFSGKFQLPDARRGTKFRGVFFQAQGVGGGFFIGESESGFVRLVPQVP